MHTQAPAASQIGHRMGTTKNCMKHAKGFLLLDEQFVKPLKSVKDQTIAIASPR
jgi:hypothetical protein